MGSIEQSRGPEQKISKPKETGERAERASDIIKAKENFLEKSTRKMESLRGGLEKTDKDAAQIKREGLRSSGEATKKSVSDFQTSLAKFEASKKEWGVFLRGSPVVEDAETKGLERTLEQLKNSVGKQILELSRDSTGNEALLKELEQQRQDLDSIQIERPSLWDATGGLFFGKSVEGLDLMSKSVKDATKKIPVVGTVVEVAANLTADLSSGVIEGAGEMAGGIVTMVRHPVETGKGMASLIGRNPQTGKWEKATAAESWREMGKAMIAAENFQKGEIGKGVGKVALNVLTTVTGAAAASKGAKAAQLAYKVGRGAEKGVVTSSVKAAALGTKVFAGEFSKGIAKTPGNALKSVGKALKAPREIARSVGKGKVHGLNREMKQATDALSETSKRVEGMTIGGKKISEIEGIAGKSSKELAEMSGGDLAKAGITDNVSLREFMDLRDELVRSEKLQTELGFLRGKLEAQKTAPAKLKQPDVKSFEKADSITFKNSDGETIAFSKIPDLATSTENLSKITPQKLAEFGINTPDALSAFEKYKAYVAAVEAEVQKLREGALKSREVLDSIMDDVAGRTKITEVGTDLKKDGSFQSGNHNKVGIKGIGRTMEKCLAEELGDASNLKDLARGTLEYDSMSELQKALRLVKEDSRVKRFYVKDNMGDPLKPSKHPAQYRDVNINLELQDGSVVELQLHIKEMLQAKEIGMKIPRALIDDIGFTARDSELVRQIAERLKKPKLKLPEGDSVSGHEMYELVRAIPNEAPKEMLDLQYKLSKLMQNLYSEAWKKYLVHHS